MPKSTKYTTISIPIPLYEKVKEFIADTGFMSVASFTTYLLRQLMSETPVKANPYESIKNEEKVKERLKNLGYM